MSGKRTGVKTINHLNLKRIHQRYSPPVPESGIVEKTFIRAFRTEITPREKEKNHPRQADKKNIFTFSIPCVFHNTDSDYLQNLAIVSIYAVIPEFAIWQGNIFQFYFL